MQYSAPARVNLIGEHTDYTGGLVLPMAIGFKTNARIEPSSDGSIHITSTNFAESVDVASGALPAHGRGHWSDYPLGVLWALREEGIAVPDFTLTLEGDVPLGAGLSSSASVEVATAMALLGLAGTQLPGEEIATLCRKAENSYAGGACGIMDQFVVVHGKAGHALLLDCRSLEYELLPLPPEVSVVICNSMVKHSVAEGEYGDRRAEVEAGQAVIVRERAGIELLRDATLEDLEASSAFMSDAEFRRCRHIITENARVIAAKDALQSADFAAFGLLMNEAHASFRDDFQASCPEVDRLVEIARTLPGCFGARITGGGFGGCTVNLVEANQAAGFREALVRTYERDYGIHADCFISQASDGAIAARERTS